MWPADFSVYLGRDLKMRRVGYKWDFHLMFFFAFLSYCFEKRILSSLKGMHWKEYKFIPRLRETFTPRVKSKQGRILGLDWMFLGLLLPNEMGNCLFLQKLLRACT